MKRLKFLILIFCAAISIPLAYFVLRTYRSLEQDEAAELRYFAETLFDQMEQQLAALVRKEEARSIDEYNYSYTPPGNVSGSSRSPLSELPHESYILGYFQNNPDGSFQTPIVENIDRVPDDRRSAVTQIKELNTIFNPKRTTASESYEILPAESVQQIKGEKPQGFASKYLDFSRSQKQKSRLGQEEKRVEQITVGQALNLAQTDAKTENQILSESGQEMLAKADKNIPPSVMSEGARGKSFPEKESAKDISSFNETKPSGLYPAQTEMLQVEVDPMQSVFIDDNRLFIFRRIVIHNQIYRQGFAINAKEFMNHLAVTYFAGQPMSRFTCLNLKVMDRKRETANVQIGADIVHPNFLLERSFPRPFSFLRASLACAKIPKSEGRKTLSFMMTVLAAIILIGLFAIYKSAKTVMEVSERRSQFVSSVTHELKTPLTNIRMYVEMLEQGIAATPEREQEYFRILGSESARLSRLISNVLEFSKLEKKQFRVNLQEGNLLDVIEEVESIMREKLKQDRFTLKVETEHIQPFAYDREGLIQVLINLIENSIKFGKNSSQKEIRLNVQPEGDKMKISISDKGPGIPRHALKKVFDDFYRVDNEITHSTRGTGIGLAFVKKYVQTIGGTVMASNNEGQGCTITISLPLGTRIK